MKLKHITIQKLFDLEGNNYDIQLYPNKNVSLLYGFNGVGKTTIIKLISLILSCNLKELTALKFSNVEILFEDNSKLIVKRETDAEYQDNIRMIRRKSIIENKDYYHPLSFTEISAEGKSVEYKFRIVGNERRVAIEYMYPQCLDEQSQTKLKKLQNNLLKKVDLHVIYANRDFNRVREPYIFGDRIQFPEENLNIRNIFCTYYEAMQIIVQLRNQIKQIEDVNNIPKGLQLYFPIELPDKLESLVKELFNKKNVSLPQKKVAQFEKIINTRMGLVWKDIKITNEGLIIQNVYPQDNALLLDDLSSGEKNLICLFLEIIFFGKSNSVFFIDEPETSLHVEWQSHLVECLLEICKKENIQVIIATHSSEVVGEYDGLTTEIAPERFRNGDKSFR